jgi:hypothetical protein
MCSSTILPCRVVRMHPEGAALASSIALGLFVSHDSSVGLSCRSSVSEHHRESISSSRGPLLLMI